MKLNEIIEKVGEINSAVAGWQGGEPSQIEIDIVLDGMKEVYAALKTCGSAAATPAVVAGAVDGSGVADAGVEPEATAAMDAEVNAKVGEDVAADTIAEAEAEVEAEVIVGRGIMIEPDVVERSEATDAAKAEDIPQESEAIGQQAEREDEALSETLFTPEEIAVKPRIDKKALLSLYGDDDDDIDIPLVQPPLEDTPAAVKIVDDVYDSLSRSADAFRVPEVPDSEGPQVDDAGLAEEIIGTDSEDDVVARDYVNTTAAPGAAVSDMLAEPVTVLGDVIAGSGTTISDAYANNSTTTDLASVIGSGKIDGIRRSIGVNDKFLLMRDLFDGDGDACDAALDALDAFGDLDGALLYIHENRWNPNSEGVRMLVDLLERKLS